ncbi:MAG: hypothetical protein V4671_08175 [Armatimonadota bacterium]
MKALTEVKGAFPATGLLATLLTGCVLLSPVAMVSAHAQAAGEAPDKALPPITLDLQDAPVRQVLEQLFNNAKVSFSIANEIQGFVTLKITDQPFENALRLILRSSSVPLTFVEEKGVFIVKPRTMDIDLVILCNLEPPITNANTNTSPKVAYDQIRLIYLDPSDVEDVLEITLIRTFSRTGNSRLR